MTTVLHFYKWYCITIYNLAHLPMFLGQYLVHLQIEHDRSSKCPPALPSPASGLLQTLWHSQKAQALSISPSSFYSWESKPCARLQTRRLPRCGSGLKVSKCSGKTEVGPEEGRASGLNVVIGTICLEGTGPQRMYFVFPLWLVSFQRQQLFTQNSGLAQL